MKNKLINNAVWIIGGKLLRAVLVLVVTMLTARYLGPSNYGVINYAAGLVAFAAPIMRLGLSTVMVREFINRPQEEGKILGTVTVLNLFSAALCIVGVTAFSAIANAGEKETVLVCAIYSALLLLQALEMVQYWFQARLLSRYSSIAILGAYVCTAAYQVYLLATSKSVYWFAASNSIEFGIIVVVLLLIYRAKGGQPLSFSWSEGKSLLSVGRFYIVADLMVAIFAQTDKIMLKLMIGSTAVGYYSAAATCATMFGFVFTAIIETARPTILEKRKQSQQEFERAMTTLYSIILYIALGVSVVITIFAPLIIRIMYGAQYTAAIAPLRLIVWYIAFSIFGSARNIWILGEEKQQYLWRINLCGAVANVALNAVLIPVWGVMGAAFASLVTQFFTNVVMGFILKPIRKNNELMMRGMDIRVVFGVVRDVIASERKSH
mgnify:CR=1 FL=1